MSAMRADSVLQRRPESGTGFGVAYYRVSTSRQANTSLDEDGFSIQAQREYCQRTASEMGVQLVDEYIDRGESARTADRPALQAMLRRVKDDADVHYVFVHKLDRLARNRADDVQIGLLLAKHGVRLVSCTENIDDTPSGKLVRGIMADINEWYSANLGQEVWKGMRKKVEHGGTPGYAPIGYENVRVKITALGKDIGGVRVHETLGPVVTECFRLYDSGRCTLADVAAYATDQGLRLRANKRLPERPMSSQSMQRLLRNRYYVGWVRFAGVAYKGTHPPLIDEATFERVQALLAARNLNKDKSHKRPHHLKGFLCCARCGRRLGITVPTKRNGTTYPYFYCLGRQNDHNSCSQGYVPVGSMEDAVRAYWATVRLPAARIKTLRQTILDNFAGKREHGQVEIERQRQRMSELEQRRQKAKAAYYADVLDLDDFKAEQDSIQRGIQAAEAIIAECSVELESIAQSLDTAFALIKYPQALYDALPERLKAMLLQAVFDKLWVLDTAVVGSELSEPFVELLTVEARLALAERHPHTADGGTSADGEVTHYRTRETTSLLLREWGPSWARPYAERPSGSLPVDKQNPGLRKGQSSNMLHLVHLARFKLNSQLAHCLKEHPLTLLQPTDLRTPLSYHAAPWRVRDRLSERDIVRLIMAFKVGAPIEVLVQRYGIGTTSVKRLLREHSIRRRHRFDELH